jgi:hypothetical protein
VRGVRAASICGNKLMVQLKVLQITSWVAYSLTPTYLQCAFCLLQPSTQGLCLSGLRSVRQAMSCCESLYETNRWQQSWLEMYNQWSGILLRCCRCTGRRGGPTFLAKSFLRAVTVASHSANSASYCRRKRKHSTHAQAYHQSDDDQRKRHSEADSCTDRACFRVLHGWSNTKHAPAR